MQVQERAYAILSSANLLHNFSVIRKYARNSKIIAMVKANAYGHGLVQVARILADAGAEALGVACIEEAIILRSHGITTEIILLQGVYNAESLIVAAEHGFTLIFHNEQQIIWLNSVKLFRPVKAWMKINTGMARLGFEPEEALAAYNILANHTNIQKHVGIMSHFACADDISHPQNAKQIESFKRVAASITSSELIKSFCNSAAIFHFPNEHYDYVRPGLALYGASPCNNKTALSLDLRPALTLKASIIALRYIKQGQSIGYGARFICPKDMLIGVGSIGYGDGYPRTAQDGTPVLVNNKLCAIAGRVSMDMIIIDLTNAPDAQIGDEVTLWGEGLDIGLVAKYTNNIAYDLLTGVTSRVKYIWQ